MNLRAKIITWSFIPTTTILLTVAWITFTAYLRVTEDMVVERNQKLTRLATSEFAAGLTQYTGLLTEYAGLLAGLPRIAYAYEGDLIIQRDVLKRGADRLSVFDGGVLVLSNQGIVAAAEPERADILGQDWSNRPYFRQALQSPGAVISDITADGPDGVEVVVLAVPIRGNQKSSQGVMLGMFRLQGDDESSLYQDIVRLRPGENNNIYLVDGQGRAIYHSDSRRIGADLSAQAAVAQVITGKEGTIRTRDLSGRDILASFAPVPGAAWGLVTEERWAALLAPTRGYRQLLLLLLLLGVTAPALVVAVGVRRITHPIIELITAARQVAGGNFDQTIIAQTGDEIEDLAQQFNVMAAQLRETYIHLEQRIADRTRDMMTLNDIAAVVSRSLDLHTILSDALDRTLQAMEGEAGGIYLLDTGYDELSIAVQRGLSPPFTAEVDWPKIGRQLSERVAQTGEPLATEDVLDSSLLPVDSRPTWATAYALFVVPLSSKGKALGTIFLIAAKRRPFSDQDVQLLTSIGRQVGMAVENARLFGQAEQRMQELEALYHADERMHRHLHLNQVLQALVDVAVDILEADKSAVFVWDERQEELVMRVARGFSLDTTSTLSFAKGEGIVGRIASSGEPFIVEDILADPCQAREHTDAAAMILDEGIRSGMYLPITLTEGIFGVFNVSFTRPRAFGANEQRLFAALVQRAALAIENAQLYERMQEMAIVEERSRLARDLHDAVTQTLFSASLIAEALPNIWENDQVEGRQLLSELRRLSRGALAEMRTLLLELRPAALVEANLGDLMRQLAETVAGRTGAPVTVKQEGRCEIPPDVHVALYRITQEAINNVVKHAAASHTTVNLRCGGETGTNKVELCISDDGCGFDPDRVPLDHLGLGIMRERAQAVGATLSVESAPGRGTQVRVVWEGK